MNPLTSPTWMMGINAVAGVIGVLESTGVTNMLFATQYGNYVLTGLAIINAIAHAYTPPIAGPLVDTTHK